MIGVEHVYLFDRKNEYKTSLKMYIDAGKVTHIPWPAYMRGLPIEQEYLGKVEFLGLNFDQQGIVNTCLWRYRSVNEWLMHIDPDEYLHFKNDFVDKTGINNKNRIGMLSAFVDLAPAGKNDISIATTNYVGHQNTFEKFTFMRSYKRNKNSMGDIRQKYIARLRAVRWMTVHLVGHHWGRWEGQTYVAPPENVVFNHYKSGAEYESGAAEVEDHEIGKWAFRPLVERLRVFISKETMIAWGFEPYLTMKF